MHQIVKIYFSKVYIQAFQAPILQTDLHTFAQLILPIMYWYC